MCLTTVGERHLVLHNSYFKTHGNTYSDMDQE